jgi:hypothetical protein
VALRIREFQALTYLLQTNASATLVIGSLGEVAVCAGEGDFSVIFHAETDMNERGLGGADAMFESILHERDEEERSNVYLAMLWHIEVHL